MPAATLPVAGPALNEFEVGGRWFACAEHVDPDLLIWTMARAQKAPEHQHDPAVADWLSCIVTFVLAATDEREHDALIATLTGMVGEDPDRAVTSLAAVFSGLLALFADHQRDEVGQRIIDNEAARAAVFPPSGAAPVVRPRSSLADVQRILAKHGRKATGEVLTPGV